MQGFTDNYIRVAAADSLSGIADNTLSAVRLGGFTSDGECLEGQPADSEASGDLNI